MNARISTVACGVLAFAGTLLCVNASQAQHLQRLIGGLTNDRFNGGTTFGTNDFIAVGAIDTTTGDRNMLVTRLDNAGRVVWARSLGTGFYDEAFSVVQTSDGNIAVAGVSADDPSRTIIVIKLNANGAVIWSNKFFGNNLIDGVANFHPVVVQGPEGLLYVIGHHYIPATTGFPQQFGRIMVIQPNGTASSDLQFRQAAEPAMISPSDVVAVNLVGVGPSMVICGTKQNFNQGPNQFLRSGFVTFFNPAAGFLFADFYNGQNPTQGQPLDLSFSSLDTDTTASSLYINGAGQTQLNANTDAVLLRTPLGGAPFWALSFQQINAAQASLNLRDPETVVWAGTHIFGDGGRHAQLQSTKIDSTQNWNFEYTYPFSSGSGGLAIAPPARDNVIFGDALDFNLGYGQGDSYFVRTDLNGRLNNTQCFEQPLPRGEPWLPAVNQFAIIGSQVPIQRTVQFQIGNPLLRDTQFCPVPGGTCCIADVATDSSDVVYNPNGSIGPEDTEAFVNGYIANNAAIADVASDSADTTCNPNGSVGPEDLEAFVNSFIAGCP